MSSTFLPEREPHRARQMAESFGADPERYDRSRPRYPAALIERILAASPGRDVLDVGCGTGIASRQLQAAGATVLGVEPDARMAEFARGHGLDVEVATFETWDPAGRSFDAVVAGQSWHWVEPVAGAHRAAEVLRPGGLLAVIRNDGQPPSEIVDAVTDVYERVLPHTFAARAATRTAVETYAAQTARTVDGIREAGGFGEPSQWSVTWEQHITFAGWLDLLPTSDGHTLLRTTELEEVLTALRLALAPFGEGFAMHYVTTVFAATRAEREPQTRREVSR